MGSGDNVLTDYEWERCPYRHHTDAKRRSGAAPAVVCRQKEVDVDCVVVDVVCCHKPGAVLLLSAVCRTKDVARVAEDVVCRRRSGADCCCRSFVVRRFDIYCRRLPMPFRLCRCHTCLPPLRGHQCHCHHSHKQPFCFSKREKEGNESEKRVGERVE